MSREVDVSPITHFFAGWLVASVPRLERQDIAVVTIASVAPDVDGIGVVPELITRNSAHPLEWFTRFHHGIAHNLLFAIVVTVLAYAIARRKLVTAGLAFLAIHLHFLMDILGSRGPDGYSWPIPYLVPFSSKLQFVWSGQWALNSWQNVVITCGLLVLTLLRLVQIGRSPVEIFSRPTDRQVVAILRQRWAEISGWSGTGNR